MSYKLRFNRKNILLAAIYAACVLIIFLTIPDKETNRYSYELGKPWNYDALVIDSNLRIDADSALVNAMVDSVMNHYTPSYYRDSQREARLLQFGPRILKHNIHAIHLVKLLQLVLAHVQSVIYICKFNEISS